jgi:hypothetical protein
MSYIDDIIRSLADRLMNDGNSVVTYKGIEFRFQEVVYANPLDFSSTTMITAIIPYYIIKCHTDLTCGVSYDSTYPKDSRTTYMNRIKACMQLARQFVTEVLPKVDFELKKDVYNNEIDEILEVLD